MIFLVRSIIVVIFVLLVHSRSNCCIHSLSQQPSSRIKNPTTTDNTHYYHHQQITNNNRMTMAMTRRKLAFVMMTAATWMIEPVVGRSCRPAAFAFTPEGGDERVKKNDVEKDTYDNVINGAVNGDYTGDATLYSSSVAYRSLSIPLTNFNNVKVPVAVWHPTASKNNEDDTQKPPIMDYPSINTMTMKNGATYSHRISVKKIGKMLAGWDFIPDFASKDFILQPTNPKVQLSDEEIPKNGPLVLLAHGYLGSRFDLSHLAESLAQKGKLHNKMQYTHTSIIPIKNLCSNLSNDIFYNPSSIVLSSFQNSFL